MKINLILKINFIYNWGVVGWDKAIPEPALGFKKILKPV